MAYVSKKGIVIFNKNDQFSLKTYSDNGPIGVLVSDGLDDCISDSVMFFDGIDHMREIAARLYNLTQEVAAKNTGMSLEERRAILAMADKEAGLRSVADAG